MTLMGKNVLVTGGAGFIGSALVRELVNEKANVIVYDNFSSGDLSNLAEVENNIEIIKGDVLDESFPEVLKSYGADYVFHLAAEPYIPKCYDNPRKIFEVNALGTLKLLLACRDLDVTRILYYSTSEVYGTARYVPMDEQHPRTPHSTYAASKLAAESLCLTMHYEHKIPVTVLRQFNVYGPRETQPYVIPEIIAQLSRFRVVRLGNVKAKRDFTYVGDAVKAAVSLIQCEKAEGEIVNLGSNRAYSIEEIVPIVAELGEWTPYKVAIDSTRLRPFDVDILQCNYSKMHRLIGWKPQTCIEDGLQCTIDWFEDNDDMWIWERKAAMLSQIEGRHYERVQHRY